MSFRFRLLGSLPLCFFLSHLRYQYSFNTPQNLLWICNISNLTLAAGLFLNLPVLIRIAFLWAIPGLPLWLIDMLNIGSYPISTFLSHVGGFIVGLIGLLKVRADRTSWLYAWVYAIVIQQLCRLFTPPQLNVNVAFRPYYGWEHTFSAYWQWWIFTAGMSGIALALMGWLLFRLLPVPKQPGSAKVLQE